MVIGRVSIPATNIVVNGTIGTSQIWTIKKIKAFTNQIIGQIEAPKKWERVVATLEERTWRFDQDEETGKSY